MRMIASNSTELIKQRAYMTNFERFVLFGRFYLIVNAKFKSTRTASIRGNMVEKSVTSNANTSPKKRLNELETVTVLLNFISNGVFTRFSVMKTTENTWGKHVWEK